MKSEDYTYILMNILIGYGEDLIGSEFILQLNPSVHTKAHKTIDYREEYHCDGLTNFSIGE